MISGKGSGYYGCYNARRKTCNNKLNISRKRIEDIIITKIRDVILTPDNLQKVYKRVEALVIREMNTLPEQVKKKEGQLNQFKKEAENYLSFIRLGNISKFVSEALAEVENRIGRLELEINSLQSQEHNNVETPTNEWITQRFTALTETLNLRSTTSARALKCLLGTITMTPKLNNAERTKPYYIANTKIGSIVLL